MKNKSLIIFVTIIIFHCHSSLNASTNTKDKIEKIDAARVEAIQKHGKLCWKCQESNSALRLAIYCSDLSDINHKFYEQVDELVLCADDLTDLEKLNYLHGDPNFKHRKAIIITMVQQGIDPNSIVYRRNETPLKEAILFRDDDFKQFLMKHGATKN